MTNVTVVSRHALVTGVTGQDGSYLAELLLDAGYNVVGLSRRPQAKEHERLAGFADRLTLVTDNLSSEARIADLLREERVDEIYHLASSSFARTSWNNPLETADVVGMSTSRILSAARHVNPEIRFYQAGSCEMFGSPDTSPQNEGTPLRPNNPYGAAKVFAYNIANSYRNGLGMHVSCGIAFNHESPRRSEEFVSKRIATAAAQVKAGRTDKLSIGNLDSLRDWTDARDIVRAMVMITQHSEAGDYVLASGETHTVREFCEAAFERVGLNWERYVELDSRFDAPRDTVPMVGDSFKARITLGWQPEIGFDKLVAEMVDAECTRLGV